MHQTQLSSLVSRTGAACITIQSRGGRVWHSPAAATRAGAARRLAVRPMATFALPASSFAFTPMESAVGGLTLGILAVSRLAVSGRVLGISGIVKGIIEGQQEGWRQAFVLGLLAGGALLTVLQPSAFEVLPVGYTLTRAIMAGLLVGVGVALGNGCTSGHGICGISRLSGRSLVATLTFIASGAASTALAQTASVFGLPQGLAPLSTATGPTLGFGLSVLALAIAFQMVLAALARQVTATSRSNSAAALHQQPETTAQLAPPTNGVSIMNKMAAVTALNDLLTGILFSLALGVSGMLKPSKIAGFLSFLSGVWDPSLMAVMGGALMLSLPGTLVGLNKLKAPLCSPSFSLPTKTKIDWQLVLGALLFGAGWGLGGICPGPAMANLVTLQPKILAFVGAMLGGMKLQALLFSPAQAPASQPAMLDSK